MGHIEKGSSNGVIHINSETSQKNKNLALETTISDEWCDISQSQHELMMFLLNSTLKNIKFMSKWKFWNLSKLGYPQRDNRDYQISLKNYSKDDKFSNWIRKHETERPTSIGDSTTLSTAWKSIFTSISTTIIDVPIDRRFITVEAYLL